MYTLADRPTLLEDDPSQAVGDEYDRSVNRLDNLSVSVKDGSWRVHLHSLLSASDTSRTPEFWRDHRDTASSLD